MGILSHRTIKCCDFKPPQHFVKTLLNSIRLRKRFTRGERKKPRQNEAFSSMMWFWKKNCVKLAVKWINEPIHSRKRVKKFKCGRFFSSSCCFWRTRRREVARADGLNATLTDFYALRIHWKDVLNRRSNQRKWAQSRSSMSLCSFALSFTLSLWLSFSFLFSLALFALTSATNNDDRPRIVLNSQFPIR